MKRCILSLLSILTCYLAVSPNNLVKVTVEPNEASVYVNNNFVGNGYAEFVKPKKNGVVVIRLECEGYKPVVTKFYGDDKRETISFKLLQDGFYRMSAVSGIVNKYIVVDIDSAYYEINDEEINTRSAWKLLHQILLNYFDEVAYTDYSSGYLQTPWHYKTFSLSDKTLRTRLTVRDISTKERVAFQIKISSEVASAHAAKNGEFSEVDRLAKEFETLLEELQTRLGRFHSL